MAAIVYNFSGSTSKDFRMASYRLVASSLPKAVRIKFLTGKIASKVVTSGKR
jgi:hypothetical protein